VLINVNREKEPHHSIVLKDKSTGKTYKIIDYIRSAAVIWSPDSKRFSINDYAGSDYANTYIVAVDQSIPRIDVQKEIDRQIKNLRHGHHEYFAIVKWMDGQRVVVHHWGYGESQPGVFCDCLIYALSGSARKCANQPMTCSPN
jgi:hypothetical protein